MGAAERLTGLGLSLPNAPVPVASYSPLKRTGQLVFVSGQLPTVDGALPLSGRVGEQVTPEQGYDLARICALNALAHIHREFGTIDAIAQVVRLGGFVASAPGFQAQPQVINGASDLFMELYGEAGKHARAAVGVSELPLGAPVEIEFLFELAQ